MRTERAGARKKGQAGAEAAIALGIFAFLAAALFTLGYAAVRGLELQGTVRAEAGESALATDAETSSSRTRTDRITVTGGKRVTVGDTVTMPGMRLTADR